MKFTKNLRHSLNCGNSTPESSLTLRSGSSDNPQFLTLIPQFSKREFHKADLKNIYNSVDALGFEAGNPPGGDSVLSTGTK
jgi:hypothetical protein